MISLPRLFPAVSAISPANSNDNYGFVASRFRSRLGLCLVENARACGIISDDVKKTRFCDVRKNPANWKEVPV